MAKTAVRRTGMVRNFLEECEFGLAILNFTLINFGLFSDKLTNPPRSHTWVPAQPPYYTDAWFHSLDCYLCLLKET